MKDVILIYANCQADGLAWFLRKTAWGGSCEMSLWRNYQLILKEQDPEGFLEAFGRCTVFLWQPCGSLCDGRIAPAGELAARVLARGGRSVSFAYQFNSGFWPWFKIAEGFDGWIAGRELKNRIAYPRGTLDRREVIIGEYHSGLLQHDCALRVALNAGEQARREASVDVRMADYILTGFQERQLFLNHNHPTGELFAELARRVCARLGESAEGISWAGLNEVGMNGDMPMHRSVLKELGLKFAEETRAHGYYLESLEKMIKELRPAGK